LISCAGATDRIHFDWISGIWSLFIDFDANTDLENPDFTGDPADLNSYIYAANMKEF
jgi:hypothetical protein